jgi:DNA-binding transcriptional ArsR family regulator
MVDIPYIAEVAALIGVPARADMLLALKTDGVLSATELAHVAGVAPNTASGHLAQLALARLVAVERQGRHRYYRLASAEVAETLEALETLAIKAAPRSRPPHVRDGAVRFARSCYDHLAGQLGVELTWALVNQGTLAASEDGFALTKSGEAAVTDLGINLPVLRTGRRRLLRSCLDWSERRPHLGGALGASLLTRLAALGWLRRQTGTRAVAVTSRGRQAFRDRFQIEL